MARLNDTQIAELVKEKKPLPENYQTMMRLKNKKGHRERDFDVKGVNGNEFRIVLRQSEFNVLDFSVILTYQPRNTNQLFILRRYNGRSHEHTNTIENQTFNGFHIHQATERYQDLGAKEATFAEPSDQYASFQEAIDCMFKECGFVLPSQPLNGQSKLL